MTANQINYSKHVEDIRTHMAQENENIRSHMVAENQRQQEIELGKRNLEVGYMQAQAALTNAGANALNAQTNAAQVNLAGYQLQEQTRHNMAVEQENYRHNVQQEANDTSRTRAGILQGLFGVAGNLLK